MAATPPASTAPGAAPRPASCTGGAACTTPPPLAWPFGWLVLTAFAAGVLAGAQAVQRALPLP